NECHSPFIDPGATASDLCAGSLAVTTNGTVNTATPGTYTITYSATDNSANTASLARTVYVVDTTPPTIACSTNINVFSTSVNGEAVNFTVTGSDLCSGSATVVCIPASGSVFPVGTTTVNCTATDASGNS